MAQYIQGHKYITIHHTVTAPAATKADLPALARSMEGYHKTKSYAQAYKTGGEFGYYYLSYHYLFAQDGSYIQVHDTKYQRVHATDTARGNTSHNRHGTAIAVVGNMDNTKPSAALIEGIAKLCAELEKKYKISFAIRGHKETALYANSAGTIYYPEKTGVYYTACPGAFMGTSKSGVVKQIINRTNELLEEKPWYEVVTKKDIKLTNPKTAYLYNIDSGEKVKTYIVNSIVDTQYELGDYYITQYSVSKKTKLGFRKSEWEKYVVPEITEPDELEKEIERLMKEIKAVQRSYEVAMSDLEERNQDLEELKTQAIKDKRTIEDQDIAVKEKEVIIGRLEADIEWMEEQEGKLKGQIKELEKSLEAASNVSIEQMSWSEVFSGVLAKLVGKKPE